MHNAFLYIFFAVVARPRVIYIIEFNCRKNPPKHDKLNLTEQEQWIWNCVSSLSFKGRFHNCRRVNGRSNAQH